MKVLVVAAHPDDEVLGCGGTMAKLADAGHEIAIAILGEGVTSRADSREDGDQNKLRELHGCSRHAADLIGAKHLHMFNLPDNRFDTVALLDVIKPIERLVEEFEPEIVYTQHGGDLNIDHQVTFRAVMTAVRPMQGSPVRALYAYEVNSSTEWSFQQFAPEFRAQVFEDISGFLDKKIEAMNAYSEESRPFPHPRSAEALRAQAVKMGSVCGMGVAEGFQLIWEKC